MKQQIDFLKSIPKGPVQLQAKWITFAAIATLALCTFISLSMAMRTVQKNHIIQQRYAENINASITFQQAAKVYPLLAGDTPLAAQIGALEKELQEKKQAYATLTRTALRYGFSNYLHTLAKITPEGLWLNDIFINKETKSATLSGFMTQPVAVSQLLQALQNETAFAGLTFHLFYVKQMKEKSYSEFKIANTSLNDTPPK